MGSVFLPLGTKIKVYRIRKKILNYYRRAQEDCGVKAERTEIVHRLVDEYLTEKRYFKLLYHKVYANGVERFDYKVSGIIQFQITTDIDKPFLSKWIAVDFVTNYNKIYPKYIPIKMLDNGECEFKLLGYNWGSLRMKEDEQCQK